MSATDAEIIAASIDLPVRFATIFDRHSDAIRRFAVARVGFAAADDVSAEVFRIAFERRDSFDLGAGDALPWLYGIAANLVRRELRGRARGYAALERLGGRRELPGEPLLDIASQIDARADLLELRDALLTLSMDELEVLLLVAWEQLSPTAAAAVLGIPAETARTRLHRARQRIRNHTGDQPTDVEVAADVTR
jgi:RNA polymerase sigma-70 factor (ECF subfamily)